MFAKLPIECKKSILTKLIPFMNNNPQVSYTYVPYDAIEADIDAISKYDPETRAILRDCIDIKKKNAYKTLEENIMAGEENHNQFMEHRICQEIGEYRIESTHSNAGCHMCQKDLPYDWPSSVNPPISMGLCSKTCLRGFRTTAIASYIKKTISVPFLKCRHCSTEAFTSDINDISDEHIYCSHKCRSVYSNYVDDDDETKYERFRASN